MSLKKMKTYHFKQGEENEEQNKKFFYEKSENQNMQD